MSEQTDTQNNTGRFPVMINPPVFFGASLIAILMVAYTITMPESASAAFSAVQGWIVGSAG